MKRSAFIRRMAALPAAFFAARELPRLHPEPARLFAEEEFYAEPLMKVLGEPVPSLTDLSDITELINQIFIGDVLPAVQFESPTATIFPHPTEEDVEELAHAAFARHPGNRPGVFMDRATFVFGRMYDRLTREAR